jgi:predicted dehydrogenase
MVNVGVIGLGTLWETRYRPVLLKLRNRIRVSAVYDPVAIRSEQVANGLQAYSVGGVLALARHADVQAVLLLDDERARLHLLSPLCDVGKPIFIAGSPGHDAIQLGMFYAAALTEGRTLMPELALRYSPATNRLQELIATRLGKPQKIVIDVDHSSPNQSDQLPEPDLLVGLFDWCRHLIRTPPLSVHSRELHSEKTSEMQGLSIRVEYHQRKSGGDSPVVELQFHNQGRSDSDSILSQEAIIQRYEITSEQGQATIETSDAIAWNTRSDSIIESLSGERSETEVMLDHFCRRVVGGLIPVADLADICRGLELVKAVKESVQTGKKIFLNDEGLRR